MFILEAAVCGTADWQGFYYFVHPIYINTLEKHYLKGWLSGQGQ